MELKINFKDNKFVFSQEIENEILKSYLTKYCNVFLEYRDFLDLKTFELILSTEKIDKRITNTKRFYFVKYNKREDELDYYYPIRMLKNIMPSIAELDNNYLGFGTNLENILGDFKKESFFLKIRLDENTEQMAYKPNVKVEDLKINKNNFQHLIKYANSLGMQNLVLDIIKHYMQKENATFEECMDFFKENPKYDVYQSALILKEF